MGENLDPRDTIFRQHHSGASDTSMMRSDSRGGGGHSQSTSKLRKAGLEDALALADLLNLPSGGGGGGGGGATSSGGKLPTNRRSRASAKHLPPLASRG